MPKITTFMTYDDQAEAAATFYVSVFPNARITKVTRYGANGPGREGSVMTVAFELDGQPFVALNGGPHFTFSEGVSLSVDCRTQEEVDTYWDRLSDGGTPGPCGWLKDRFGLSWQIVPSILPELLGDADPERSKRVMQAMLAMQKIDVDALKKAYAARPEAVR